MQGPGSRHVPFSSLLCALGSCYAFVSSAFNAVSSVSALALTTLKAQGPPGGGGRSPAADPAGLAPQRHFCVFAVSFPGQEALTAIYSTILAQHLAFRSVPLVVQRMGNQLVAAALGKLLGRPAVSPSLARPPGHGRVIGGVSVRSDSPAPEGHGHVPSHRHQVPLRLQPPGPLQHLPGAAPGGGRGSHAAAAGGVSVPLAGGRGRVVMVLIFLAVCVPPNQSGVLGPAAYTAICCYNTQAWCRGWPVLPTGALAGPRSELRLCH